MSEEYGNNFVVLTDENGKEIELEHLDTVEYNGQTYMAFIPAEMSVEDAYELMIMKVELEENGEEALVTLDDGTQVPLKMVMDYVMTIDVTARGRGVKITFPDLSAFQEIDPSMLED